MSNLREIIESRLVDGFEKQLYQAALYNLDDIKNQLRFNNFAYAMRELVRHVLNRLAPDMEVLDCCWYKNEMDRENGITRIQRVNYAVQGGLSNEYVTDVLGLDIQQIRKSLKKSHDNLSKHTHINVATFDIPEDRIGEFVDQTLSSIYEFFVSIEENRQSLISALWEQIDQATIEAALRETIQDIDELASHHYIEEIYTDQINITNISSRFIEFDTEGSVACELQWGSNGDMRRGDGAVIPKSFPFTCSLRSFVYDPSEVQIDDGDFQVDTSSWWEGKR